jgi:hypothetical protein
MCMASSRSTSHMRIFKNSPSKMSVRLSRSIFFIESFFIESSPRTSSMAKSNIGAVRVKRLVQASSGGEWRELS